MNDNIKRDLVAKLKCRRLLTGLLLSSAILSAPAMAQDNAADNTDSTLSFDEIIVTAQKRAENLQKIPLSITALGSDAIAERGITNAVELQSAVPGFQSQVYNGVVIPFLRGVGSTGSVISNEPSVGTYVDGVYFPRVPGSFFELRNVERVEVLKGPQGTLFGRNSTGGIINIVTKKPSYETSMSGSLSYGRFDAVQGDLYVTTGLSDSAAIDFSVTGKTDDGYGRNITLDKRYSYIDSILLRSKLLVEPSDKTSIVLSGFYSGSKTSGSKPAFPGTSSGTWSFSDGLGDPNDLISSVPLQGIPTKVIGFYNSYSDYEDKDIFKVWGANLRIDHDLDFGTFTSISAYSKLTEDNFSDSDYGPNPYQQVPFYGKVKLFTQELQLASPQGSPFDWIVGLYYYNNRTSYPFVQISGTALPFVILAPAETRSESYAGFAQATVEVLPDLKLTGGVRYTHDKVSADGQLVIVGVGDLAGPPDSFNTDRVTFRAALDYEVTPDALLYGSFSRGYKAGKYNILTYDPNPTEPETLDAYEVGFKTQLLDRRLRLNGAAFYYDISNLQTQTQTNSSIIFGNAGGSEVKGAEIEAEALVSNQLTLRASATYLDSQYTDYGYIDANGNCVECAVGSTWDSVRGGAIPVPGGIVATGNRTPLAAKFTFNLGFSYTLDTGLGELLLSADWYRNSGFYNEADNNNLRQPAFDLVNAQLRLGLSDNMAVRLWGKNLLDEKYSISAGTNAGSSGYVWNPAPPITYGVGFDFTF